MSGRRRPGGKAKGNRIRGGRKRRVSPSRTIRRIQEALSLDLLTSGYRAGLSDRALYWACQSHCYVASEAAYHLFAKAKGFVPYVFSHGDGSTHWWLANPDTGEVLDPSRPQLGSKKFPYSKGRRAVFLTVKPSERARELMRRVKRAGG